MRVSSELSLLPSFQNDKDSLSLSLTGVVHLDFFFWSEDCRVNLHRASSLCVCCCGGRVGPKARVMLLLLFFFLSFLLSP